MKNRLDRALAKYVLPCLLCGVSTPIQAMGVGFVASTEMTQMLNNIELGHLNLSSIESVRQATQQSYTLASQYQTQLQTLGQVQLQNLGLPRDLLKLYQMSPNAMQSRYQAFDRQLQEMSAQIKNNQSSVSQVYWQIEKSGLDGAGFLQRLKSKHTQEYQSVAKMMEHLSLGQSNLRQSYQQIENFQEDILKTNGLNQSMQLMNSQLNALLMQNNEIIRASQTALGQSVSASDSKNRQAAQNEVDLWKLKQQKNQQHSDLLRYLRKLSQP